MRFFLIVTLTLLLLVTIVANMDKQDEQIAHSVYCDNVTTFILTNGKSGWSDFKGTYEKNCF